MTLRHRTAPSTRLRFPLPLLLLLPTLLSSAPAAAQSGDAPGFAAAASPLLAEARHSWVRGGRFPDVAGEARALYEARGGAPLWLTNGHPTAQANLLMHRMAHADRWGLEPDHYVSKRLTEAGLRLADGSATQTTEQAQFDVGLTVAALRLVSDLSRGQVDPARAHATLQIDGSRYDFAAAVDSMSRGGDVDALLDRAQPPWIHYRLLVAALERYRTIESDTSLVPIALPKKLSPGEPYREAPRLRRLLAATSDLPPGQAGPVAVDTVYGPDLVAGVKSFQARHGLTADGVVGGGTADRLNRPLAERVEAIRLALERWRWLPRRFEVPPIFVNIPAFKLYAFRTPQDEEKDMLTMDVIVGRAYDTRTPVFTERMKYVVFSPYWEVPYSIATKELRPAGLRNPGYFAKHDMELVRGTTVVPASAENIAAIGRGVRVRQKPGDQNALGHVKVMLPNPHNVYLHDTNARARFNQ
jgi:murein L,D-transpeptidase YcbB/YkuD